MDRTHSPEPPQEDSGRIAPDDVLFHPVSRRVAAIWNMIFSDAVLVLVLARNLALVPLFIKHIGIEEYSAWLVTGAVLMALTNIDLGLMGVLGQQVAASYGKRNRDELQRLIGTGLGLALALAIVMGGITAALSPLIPASIDAPPHIKHELTICFLLVAITNSIQLVGFATGGLLRSLQRSFLPGFFLFVSELTALIVTAWLTVTGWGLYAIGIGLIVRSAIEAGGTGAAFVWIVLGKLKLRTIWDRNQVKRLARLSTYQFLTQLAGKVKINLDAFVVGALLSKEVGGAYALTIKAHDTVRLFSQGFGGAISPAMAHLHGEKNESRFKEITFLLFKIQAVTAAIGFGGVIAFNRAFMSLWVGPAFYSGSAVNILAAFAGVAYLLSVAPYESIFTRGKFSTITKAVWIEAIARFALMVILLWAFGVVGTPLTSFATQVICLLLPLTYLLGKSLHFDRAEFSALATAISKLLVGPLLLAAVFYWAVSMPTSWFTLIAQAILFIFLSLGVTWLLDREMVLFVLRRGKARTN